MTSTTPKQASAAATAGDEPAWLRYDKAAGRASLRAASALDIAATMAGCAAWAGLSLVAGVLVSFGSGQELLPEALPGLLLLLIGGMLRALLGASGARCASVGGAEIGSAIRRRVADASLAPVARRDDADPAAVAEAAVELADEIGDYQAKATPLRRSAPWSMGIIVLATAIAHWPAGILLLLSTLVIPANMRLAGLLAQDGNDTYLSELNRLGAVVLDGFRGVATLRRFGAVDSWASRVRDASRRLNEANMAVLKRAFVSSVVMDTVVTFSIAVLATYIGMTLLRYVAIPGAPLDLAHGLFVLILCPLYFEPVRRSAAAFHDRERADAAIARLDALFEEAPAATDEAMVAIEMPMSAPLGIVLEEVVLAGEDGEAIVSAPGRILAAPGCWTAVIGPSGAGKTTLLRCLAGLRPVDRGAVKWVQDARSWAPRIGGASWIGQGTLILDGSLADNVRLGREGASDAEVSRALDEAGLGALVATLPEGIRTRCGRGGRAFSAGESRRVALARALLRDAGVWILDEPTSHLDAETEVSLGRSLRAATRGRTVIVATHSRTLVDEADAVWTVEDGIVRPRERGAGQPHPQEAIS